MDYEQKYKEALGWVRSIYSTMQGADKEDAEHYFPELKKSEDEKMLDSIIEDCKKYLALLPKQIAWLEKQKKQKPVEWSKEDIEIIKMIEDCLRFYKIAHCVTLPSVETCIDWLKSLKPNHWKPSEKQMSLLLAVINEPNNVSSESCHISLKKLYEDLKKL